MFPPLNPYGKLEYILHQMNLDWLVRQVKKNTDDIEDIREHGSGACPDITAAATVDSGTGTPSVNVVKTGTDEEPTFTFNFSNLKGAAGADGRDGVDGRDGTDGVTPVISATASVNATTGTPSVSVTKSGTDAAPSFAFAFSNLKGATGSTGPAGPQGPAGASSGDALPRYNVNEMSASIADSIATAYLNGKVPFYLLLANGGSTPVTKSYISLSSPTYPNITVYPANSPVEVPANDVVLVKFYWSGPDMLFDTVSSGGGGGGLTSLTFTVNPMKFRYYDSEYQPQQSISWAYHYQPISFVATSNINSYEQIGAIDDASLRTSGTALVYNPNNGTTIISYYVIDSGMVLIMSSMSNNSRVTLF